MTEKCVNKTQPAKAKNGFSMLKGCTYLLDSARTGATTFQLSTSARRSTTTAGCCQNALYCCITSVIVSFITPYKLSETLRPPNRAQKVTCLSITQLSLSHCRMDGNLTGQLFVQPSYRLQLGCRYSRAGTLWLGQDSSEP